MKTRALALVAVATAAAAQAPDLVEVTGNVEQPNGGAPIGFSIRLPKGTQPVPGPVAHNRSYGKDVSGGRLVFNLYRLMSEGPLDGVIRYQGGLSGGLESKQDLGGGATLALMKPMGPIQIVMVFKRVTKGNHLQLECIGPPPFLETLKASCASFKTDASFAEAAAPAAAAAASATRAPARLSPEKESALRADLEKLIGTDRATRRAAALAKFKGGMYCDKVKKQFAYEGKCQFGKPSSLVVPSETALADGYRLDFDGATFQLKQAVIDFKPLYDKDGFRGVALAVFEAKWGAGRPDAANPDKLSWPGKGGSISLEYVGDHWRMRDVMMEP